MSKEISKGCVFISFYSSVKDLTLMTSFLEISVFNINNSQAANTNQQNSNYTQMFRPNEVNERTEHIVGIVIDC